MFGQASPLSALMYPNFLESKQILKGYFLSSSPRFLGI